MAFGPEFISGLVPEFSAMLPWRVSRVEGGESWTALKVSFHDSWLLLSWGAGSSGCCLAGSYDVTALRGGAEGLAPMASAMRSRLVKGDITAVRQINNDRVIEFELVRRVAAGTSVKYFIVLEITEPISNLLLLDGERRIEEAARHSPPDRNSRRTLLPGCPYLPPPAFDGISTDGMEELKFDDVPNLLGIGRPLTRRIQDCWAEHTPHEWLDAVNASLVYHAVPLSAEPNDKDDNENQTAGQTNAVREDEMPCLMLGKNYITRFPLPLKGAEVLEGGPLAAAEAGVLRPMSLRGRDRLMRAAVSRLRRAVKSRERHRDGLLKQLRDCAEADVFRRKGTLLLQHTQDVPPRAEKVTLAEWDGSAPLTIELDPRLSVTRNADRYFKKYRKAKGNPQALQEGIDELESAIREMEEQADLLATIDDLQTFDEAVKDIDEWLTPEEAKRAQNKKKNKNKKEQLPPHLHFELDGAAVLVGLSARGNRYVTFKCARADDIWLHAHEVPGAHVIVRGASREDLEGDLRSVLEFASSLAAYHSKGAGSGSVQVDYTERRHVRAVPGTTALVTYTNPGTIRAVPRGA